MMTCGYSRDGGSKAGAVLVICAYRIALRGARMPVVALLIFHLAVDGLFLLSLSGQIW